MLFTEVPRSGHTNSQSDAQLFIQCCSLDMIRVAKGSDSILYEYTCFGCQRILVTGKLYSNVKQKLKSTPPAQKPKYKKSSNSSTKLPTRK